MKKVFFTLLLTCAYTIQINAQSLQLKGRILSGKNVIEYANILLQTNDSAFVTGGVTDQRGRFSFSNINPGNYCLKVSSLGYEPQLIALNTLHESKDLGDIEMDSTSIALGEVVVKASYRIDQPDKSIYLPTAHQIKSSTNGLNILQQMKLNRLQVDPMRKTITSSNQGEVQLRINGAKADIQEIQSLRPEDIQRIEYHDDPSLRYGTQVAAVIDYITKVRQSGGYVGIDTQNSPQTGFGNNGINSKFNYKNSEFALNYWGMYRDFDGYWRENMETFNWADGTSFTRKEDGTPNKLKENHHYTTLSYSYRNDEKWFFVSRFKTGLDLSSMISESYLYPVTTRESGVSMLDDSSNRNFSPSLDLYFQRNYKHKQTLMFNAVGTYIRSKNSRYYTEDQANERLTDIHSDIRGNKYSLILEGIYEKGFKSSRLSTGGKWYQSYANNNYAGSINTDTRLHATMLHLYSEWQGKSKNWGYMVGVSGVYGALSQPEKKYSKFILSPRFRLNYKVSNAFSMRLNGYLFYNTPDLSELSDVQQLIDSLQIRRGNPDLKETKVYQTQLFFDYHKGLFNANLNIFYQYQHHPMMEATYRENNLFVRTVINQRNWQKVNPQLELKVGPIKDILNLSLTTGMNYFDSKGVDYRHHYTNWYYRFETSAMYKNWMAMFQIQNHNNDMYGETINYGENYHMLVLQYKLKNLTLGVMTLNPFVGKNSYKRPSENLNQYAPSSSCWHLRESSRLYVATLTWNFSFGRKVESVEKHLNNEDTKTGAMKSGK